MTKLRWTVLVVGVWIACLVLTGCGGNAGGALPGVDGDVEAAGKIHEYRGDGGGSAKPWPAFVPPPAEGVDTRRVPEKLSDAEDAVDRAVPRKQISWFKVQGTSTDNVWWVVTLQPTADEDSDLYVMKGDGGDYETEATCLGYSNRTPGGAETVGDHGYAPDWVAFRRPLATNGHPSAQVAVFGTPDMPSNKRFTLEADQVTGLSVDGPNASGAVAQGQSDWYMFTAVTGAQYTLHLTCDQDADLYLYQDAATEFVDEHTAWGGGSITFTAAESGKHFVRVYGYSAVAGGYQVWVTTGSGGGYEFVTQWGSEGTGNSQFKNPTGVAVDASDRIYVVDRNNDRIQKFDAAGTYLTQWGTTGGDDGEFDDPWGVTVSASGNVLVADMGNNRIQKFNLTGVFLSEWGTSGPGNGQFNGPHDVAIFSGKTFVTDRYNHRIQKFNSSGAYLTQWGSEGGGESEFYWPMSVAVDGAGNVYVADTQNNRVQKFTAAGAFVRQWGTVGVGEGQFSLPTGIAVDSAGGVFVTDSLNDRVQKFDTDGAFLTTWGSTGNGNGKFQDPSAIAVDSGGNVYVADHQLHCIQKFRPLP